MRKRVKHRKRCKIVKSVTPSGVTDFTILQPLPVLDPICEKLTNDRLQVKGKCRRNKTQLLYICLPPYNSNKMPELVLVSVGDITSSWYIPASSLSILLITKSGLFTWQELPEYLGQLIIIFVQQLLCVFCQLTSKDPVEFDIMFAFSLVVPP